MTTTDKRKRSLYFPDNILREMQSEAKRQERSLSWIVQYAWRIAREELMRLPSVGNAGYNPDHDRGHHSDVDHIDDKDHGHEEAQGTSQGHHNSDYPHSGYPHHGG